MRCDAAEVICTYNAGVCIQTVHAYACTADAKLCLYMHSYAQLSRLPQRSSPPPGSPLPLLRRRCLPPPPPPRLPQSHHEVGFYYQRDLKARPLKLLIEKYCDAPEKTDKKGVIEWLLATIE